MKTETTTPAAATKTHSVTFRKDVTIFTDSKASKNILIREMTYKKFFALELSEFTLKLDHSDSDAGKARTIKKLERAGYTVNSLDDAMYKFSAVRLEA